MALPREQRIVRFAKFGRHAELRIGTTPGGLEIRCIMDGTLLWSRICGTSRECAELLPRLHSDFLEMEWEEVRDATA